MEIDFASWENKLKGLLKKEIDDYKKLVSQLPDDEKILAYMPSLEKYEDNICHLIDVYTSAKSMNLVGRPIYCNEINGGLEYSTIKKNGKKKNGNVAYE